MATTSSTTGINVSGIAKIEEAIKKYKNNISKSFDFANLKKAASAAVKGSRAEQDLNKYNTTIN